MNIKKMPKGLIALYYILYAEITLTGFCYAEEAWAGFVICGVVSFVIWRLIKNLKKKQ